MTQLNYKAGIVLLAAVVLASGCTDNTKQNSVTVSQNTGVEITSFTASPSSLTAGQPATLQLSVKNRGGVDAKNVQAHLTNPEFGSDSGLWSITRGDAWKEGFNTLPGPDPDAGQTALTRTFQWNLKAPNKDNKIAIDYGFDADVFYKYQTQAVTQMRVVNTNSMEEQPTQTNPTVENTGGPIQMGVQITSPVIFTASNNGNDKNRSFCVTIQNVGAGTPFLYEKSKVNGKYYRGVNDDITDKIKLSVNSPSSFIKFSDSSATKELISESPSYCFDMTANYVSTSEGQKTAPITITANYGYRVEDSTSITLKSGP
ncbi:MAG: hypothetical protein ABEK00_00985 [Candidatus Nanohaloarchaea archaeon]